MSRNRTITNPGETPDPVSDADSADLAHADSRHDDALIDTPTASLAPLKTTSPLTGNADQQLATLIAQMAEMQARDLARDKQLAELAEQNANLSRMVGKDAKDMPVAVVLPTVAEAMANNPDAPVLTQDGWYTPPVTTANPELRRNGGF